MDSEWFDRGWTLQELIAPAAVSFFNHDWQLVGTKLELLESLSEKTGVPSDVLGNTAEPWTYEGSPKKKFAISISKTFAQDTYVRVRDLEDINQGLREEDSGKERLLHFVIEPKSPPVNIIHGFWLRTLQPPGHDVSDVSIVSNSTPLENGYIQQIARKGDSGIVQLQPKPTSFPLNWSRIRWMRFWFSASNDPVVWIGNDTQTEKLRTFYDEMLTIEQSESKVRRGKFKSLHKSFWEAPEGKEKVEFDARDVGHDWPHGNAIIPVNRKKGLHEFILPNLNLQVSVRLQPYHNPKIEASRLNNQGRSQNTTLVWVVDITSPDARRFYPSQPLQMKWSHWFVNLLCFACIQTCQSEGCALCLCCCWCSCKEYAKLHPRYNLTCYDFFYPCCQGRWLKEKEAKAKIAYAKEAGSKIPRLKPGASTVYALTTIRPMYDCQEDCLKWVGTSDYDYKRTMKGE
ncbi:hypothetical protein SLS60_001813 [Paraconiothyrium brasiliense]|uniref:Uncharacterized protein n=1 Tax=Paraconiothyrium brasiliense TaxID=300254 RepID=A0ABR3S0E7_9PLEO